MGKCGGLIALIILALTTGCFSRQSDRASTSQAVLAQLAEVGGGNGSGYEGGDGSSAEVWYEIEDGYSCSDPGAGKGQSGFRSALTYSPSGTPGAPGTATQVMDECREIPPSSYIPGIPHWFHFQGLPKLRSLGSRIYSARSDLTLEVEGPGFIPLTACSATEAGGVSTELVILQQKDGLHGQLLRLNPNPDYNSQLPDSPGNPRWIGHSFDLGALSVHGLGQQFIFQSQAFELATSEPSTATEPGVTPAALTYRVGQLELRVQAQCAGDIALRLGRSAARFGSGP